jgi:hypothetical protein
MAPENAGKLNEVHIDRFGAPSMKQIFRYSTIALALLCAPPLQADTKSNVTLRAEILKLINDRCPDSWCERGDMNYLKFRTFRCDKISCLLGYTIRTTRSEKKVCRLKHIATFQETLVTGQGAPQLSEQLIADVDSCF